MVYDGVADTLSSQTRKGKSLLYDKEKMLEKMWKRDVGFKWSYKEYSETPFTFRNYVNSRYVG